MRNEIESSGAMSFARFMELALYHPEHGYYASGRARIGRAGDFFTNVSVGAIFGKLLAAQFAEVWEKLGRPGDFTIVEQGGHDGQFAADVLSALRESDCFAATNYIMVEPFPQWRDRQRKTLGHFRGKISWLKSIDEIEPFTGIYFGNELFDSLPVHLFDGGQELFVTINNDSFELESGPCSRGMQPPKLSRSATSRQTEVSRAARTLVHDIVGKVARGVILTIDYGYTREQLAARDTGTLQIRAQHRKLASPFEQIGHADISAHVDWTSLIETAESAGAHVIGFTDQHHFLTGILSDLIPPNELKAFQASQKRALQTLLHPEMMGRSFQALALGRTFSAQLSGFRFARASH